jgi:hypothetical protein
MRSGRSIALALCAAIVTTFGMTGCSVEPKPVEGTLTLDGKPLSKATVVFVSENEKDPHNHARSAYASTDENGRFHLLTRNQEGAFPGDYKVTVSRFVYPEGTKEPTTPGEIKQLSHLRQEGVPTRYTKFEETPLRISVPRGGTKDISLQLVSSGP